MCSGASRSGDGQVDRLDALERAVADAAVQVGPVVGQATAPRSRPSRRRPRLGGEARRRRPGRACLLRRRRQSGSGPAARRRSAPSRARAPGTSGWPGRRSGGRPTVLVGRERRHERRCRRLRRGPPAARPRRRRAARRWRRRRRDGALDGRARRRPVRPSRGRRGGPVAPRRRRVVLVDGDADAVEERLPEVAVGAADGQHDAQVERRGDPPGPPAVASASTRAARRSGCPDTSRRARGGRDGRGEVGVGVGGGGHQVAAVVRLAPNSPAARRKRRYASA